MALEIHPENLSHEGKALWGEDQQVTKAQEAEESGSTEGQGQQGGGGEGSCDQEHHGQVRGLK